MHHQFLSLPSFIGFVGSVGKSFSISLKSFTRQNEIGARGAERDAENEESAVNHAGKVEAVEREHRTRWIDR